MLSPHANPYVQIKSHSFNQTHFLFFSYHLQSDSCAKLYHKKNSHIYVARQWWLEQSRAHMMNVNLFFLSFFHSLSRTGSTAATTLLIQKKVFWWKLESVIIGSSCEKHLKVVKIEREENFCVCCETKSKVKQKAHKRKLR